MNTVDIFDSIELECVEYVAGYYEKYIFYIMRNIHSLYPLKRNIPCVGQIYYHEGV